LTFNIIPFSKSIKAINLYIKFHFIYLPSSYVFLVLQLVNNSKQQQKLSLIENGNGATKPQIVKKTINGHPTPVHTDHHNPKMERGKAFRQILAAFIANIGPMNTGLIFGFSAVVIPQLQSPASSIQINEDQASWVGKLKC
jgi:hypothetical protein